MNNTSGFLTLSIIVMLSINLTSCDEEVTKQENTKPDSEALSEWFTASVDKKLQRFVIDASTGVNVIGNQGTQFKFGLNAFTTKSGVAVSGEVDVEVIEIYDRAAMLLTNKPTNGRMENGDIATLISGGEFYLNVSQNGADLKLKNGFTIIAPTENTGKIDHDMRLFTGEKECEQDSCDVVWVEENDRQIEIGEFQNNGGLKTAYYAFQTKFGWTNIDRWYNDPRPMTTIYVDVPEGFDNTNCAVFLTYDGEPTALAGLDIYDKNTKLFTEHYGLIPIGLKVHFILVSIVDNNIHYALQSATIVENHVEVIDQVNAISEQGLVNIINSLP